MEKYLSRCYEFFFEKGQLSECYIRLDRSHIVKQILRMQPLSSCDERIMKLFQRVFGFLITIDDIEYVATTIKNIFVLILNKYEHNEFV